MDNKFQHGVALSSSASLTELLILLPLKQAIIDGLFLATALVVPLLVVLIVVLLYASSTVPWREVGLLGGALWIGVTAIQAALRWPYRNLEAHQVVWQKEEEDQTDLDGDSQVGQPGRTILVNPPVRQIMPPPSRLEEFTKAVFTANRTDVRTLRNYGFTDTEWALYVNQLLKLGILRLRDASGRTEIAFDLNQALDVISRHVVEV